MFLLLSLVCFLGGMRVSQPLYEVRQYGARGDGTTKDTAAIQKAIEAAAEHGGGIVLLSPGRYLSGTLHLKSHVTLQIGPGAFLIASPARADFDPYEPLPYDPQSDKETSDFHFALIAGKGLENVTIIGQGVIDGNRTQRGDRAAKGEPKPIALKNCHNVTIRDITVQNAPNYAVSFLGCEDVVVDGVRVENGFSDGIDPDCSRNVRISNCFVDCYDDGICLKASLALGVPRPTEDVTVTNCVVSSASNQFKLGTESNGGFRNIALSNCAFYVRTKGKQAKRDRSGIDIATVNGGTIDGIVVSNIVMRDIYCPLYVRLGDQAKGNPPTRPGILRNVSFSNIVATGATMTSSFTGLAGHPLEHIALDNVQITMRGGEKAVTALNVPEDAAHYPESEMFGTLPAYGLYARHIEDLTLRNVRVGWLQEDGRSAVVMEGVRKIEVNGLSLQNAVGKQPLVWLHQCREAFVHACRSQVEAPLFLRVSGHQSSRIRLFGNDLSLVSAAVERAPGTPRNVVLERSNFR